MLETVLGVNPLTPTVVLGVNPLTPTVAIWVQI